MSSRFTTNSTEETLSLGRRFGEELVPPATVLLCGDLGAGKTVLTRGIVEGLGCADSSVVHSPTFTLVNQYQTDRGTVYHVDLYRLDTLKEQYSIGIEELLSKNAVVIIEWADKLQVAADQAIRITLERDQPGRRVITIPGPGIPNS